MSRPLDPLTFGVSLKAAKDSFFDRPKVKALTNEAVRKGLSKAGAYVQKAMIRIHRKVGKKGKPSVAPAPPKFRNTSNPFVSLRNVLFYYDDARQVTIVGPVKLNQQQEAGGAGGKLSTGTVPALHEFGGSVGIREKFISFNLAVVYQRFGKDIGDEMRRAGMFMRREDFIKIHGTDAAHMIDKGLQGAWIRAGARKRNQIIVRSRTAKYPQRKFALPALMKSLPKIPQEFASRVGTA